MCMLVYCRYGLTVYSCVFFFFQAEDGIRDWSVTGVQTCALPISFEKIGVVRFRFADEEQRHFAAQVVAFVVVPFIFWRSDAVTYEDNWSIHVGGFGDRKSVV